MHFGALFVYLGSLRGFLPQWSGTEAENLGGSLLTSCFLTLHRLLQAVALS